MTNEEAIDILEDLVHDAWVFLKTEAQLKAWRSNTEVRDRIKRKSEAFDMAIHAIQGYEILGDAVKQALDKYLAPNLATEIKNEITRIVAGCEEVTACQENEPPSGS